MIRGMSGRKEKQAYPVPSSSEREKSREQSSLHAPGAGPSLVLCGHPRPCRQEKARSTAGAGGALRRRGSPLLPGLLNKDSGSASANPALSPSHFRGNTRNSETCSAFHMVKTHLELFTYVNSLNSPKPPDKLRTTITPIFSGAKLRPREVQHRGWGPVAIHSCAGFYTGQPGAVCRAVNRYSILPLGKVGKCVKGLS